MIALRDKRERERNETRVAAFALIPRRTISNPDMASKGELEIYLLKIKFISDQKPNKLSVNNKYELIIVV